MRSQKRRNRATLRKLVVDGRKYTWKVSEDYYGRYLTIWRNWEKPKMNVLIYCERVDNEIAAITPKFVRGIAETLFAGNKTRQEEAKKRAKKAVPKGKVTTAEINAALDIFRESY